MKRFAALARVSSREQAREGFSLAVQVEALHRWAAEHGGKIVHMVEIAETASKRDERHGFRALLDYCRKSAKVLDGLLVYKLDRAARNLPDYVELLKLRSEHGVQLFATSQPTDDTPSGRLLQGFLASIAGFYTEQMSKDIREGHERRVRDGWFSNRPPYGYTTMRRDGRSIVITREPDAGNVRRCFELYGQGRHTVDELVKVLEGEGRVYKPYLAKFPRTTLHDILRDRAYIGEVEYGGKWHPGRHERLVDAVLWERVQTMLAGRTYRGHEMAYASDRVKCAFCGRPVTGERKHKGGRTYVYYRCGGYNAAGHPRVRVTEAELDGQLMAAFDALRVEDPAVRAWMARVIALQARAGQAEAAARRDELQRQVRLVAQQQDRLLNVHLAGQIDAETFAGKHDVLRDRMASLEVQLKAVELGRAEDAGLAVKVFELSQNLKNLWQTADHEAKGIILDAVTLNRVLDGKTLVFGLQKPFDQLAGVVGFAENQGDRI